MMINIRRNISNFIRTLFKIPRKRVQVKGNSWVLKNNYFCSCSHKFTKINSSKKHNIECSFCGNDSFKDADDFLHIKKILVWKEFYWDFKAFETDESWNVFAQYEIPIYDDKLEKIVFSTQTLVKLELKKNGNSKLKIFEHSKVLSRYRLFINQELKQLSMQVINSAKNEFYKFIINNKKIRWIDTDKIAYLNIDKKIDYLRFFLKNSHLRVHNFYYWENIEKIVNYTQEYPTEKEMLNLIINNRQEKSIKKAIYKAYTQSIKTKYYNPSTDYIFSRTIENVNFLMKLLVLSPKIKEYLFNDNDNDNSDVIIEFILFLKKYYSEKQITIFFSEYVVNNKDYKNIYKYWKDTLHIIKNKENSIKSLEEYFTKVKLTPKKLHDELVRVFHIKSYTVEKKEYFKYDEKYIFASSIKKNDLIFILPITVRELSV